MCIKKQMCFSIIAGLFFTVQSNDSSAQYKDTKRVSVNLISGISEDSTTNGIEINLKKNFTNSDLTQGKDSLKNKIYLSFGTGVALTSLYPYSGFNPGVNFQLSVMKLISQSHAIRGDFQYSLNVKQRSEGSTAEGGHLNSYALKFDFLPGRFRNTSKVNGYAILGGGLNVLKESDVTYRYRNYDYNTMSYTGEVRSTTIEKRANTYLNLDLGGGLNYKISKAYEIYCEAQYTFPLMYLGRNGAGIPYIYGIFFGAPSLKAGVRIGL